MARKQFKEFIPDVQKQLQPMLDAFLEKLGIRRGKEEVGRLQKMEKMGRVTTGFVPEMYREVGEQVGMEETGFRASHQANILEQAMKLFGLEDQWYQFQQQMAFQEKQNALDRALSRELAKLSGAGAGGGGISFDFGNLFGGGGGGVVPDKFIPSKLPSPERRYGKYGRVGTYQPVIPKKVSPAIRGLTKPLGTTYRASTRAYQPTQKATTYRGTRLGRI